MSLLFRVLYAAHARGTHHKLALDALTELRNPEAEGWQRLFLKHAALYMEGAKAPDDEFKDFKNHVLHVEQDYWGGAIAKSQSWYGHLVAALTSQDWPQAVYCAGVLSHYYVDPIHPFHTGQSAAENNVHRAVEWSISKSYNDLRARGLALPDPLNLPRAEGDDWLKDLVCRGAERSHGYYSTLLVHYDFHKGVVDPPAGLDETSRTAVAELLTYASASFALVLDRAFEDAGVSPPEVSLTLDTVLATLAIPRKMLLNKIADAADRKQVEAMYDELVTTGKVDATLSEDDRTVRDLYAAEVGTRTAEKLSAARAERIRETPAAPKAPPKLKLVETAPKPAEPAPAAPSRLTAALTPVAATAPDAPKAKAEPQPAIFDANHTSRTRLPRIKAGDAVEDAPSIGLKTAERLAKIGVVTIGDLLAFDPDAAAEKLDTRHIDGSTIRDWQDQARLAMTLPELSGTKAQLLVGGGYRDVAAISAAEVTAIRAALATFAATSEGERLMRGGKLPEETEIARWIEDAKGLAKAA
ncbi:MAG: DUF4332 domain-containing protein [Hyphomicrobiaceae bacterium]